MLRFMFNKEWCFVKIYDDEQLIKVVNYICDFDAALAEANKIYEEYKQLILR